MQRSAMLMAAADVAAVAFTWCWLFLIAPYQLAGSAGTNENVLLVMLQCNVF